MGGVKAAPPADTTRKRNDFDRGGAFVRYIFHLAPGPPGTGRLEAERGGRS